MPKNKTLPRNFEQLLKDGDLASLKAVFDKCSFDAVGGYSKQTALAFDDCSDGLARWLLEQGANIAALDSRGNTPLQSRSRSWRGRILSLIALGADINYNGGNGSALHFAASAHREENVKILLEHGAQVDPLDHHAMTPLESALQQCSNATIEPMAKIADLLLNAGAVRSPKTQDFVRRIGTNFEFHRSNFNPEALAATSTSLERLYTLFGVPSVPGRVMHDGVSLIVVKASRWEDRHQELWELLVPSSGAAKTVQGELIRISGRIARELDDNGGVNWDAQFKQMADAWLMHIRSGKRLPQSAEQEAAALVKDIKSKSGDTSRFCEIATEWVMLNPEPILLPTPTYDR